MIDLDRLRINVTSGTYVVDPHAVADALLCRAGIMAAPAGDAEQTMARPDAVSPAGAHSRRDPAPSPHRD